MDDTEFQETVTELRNKGFIKHKIVVDRATKIYGFAARGIGKTDSIICYYPDALKFFDKRQMQFILLHEEGHCNTLTGSIPHVGESYATKYAKESIRLIDPTINPDVIEESATHAVGEYRKTIQLNCFQRLILSIPFIGRGIIGYFV